MRFGEVLKSKVEDGDESDVHHRGSPISGLSSDAQFHGAVVHFLDVVDSCRDR